VETSCPKHIKARCNCDCIVRPTGVKTNEARSLIQTRPKDKNRVTTLFVKGRGVDGGGGRKLYRV